MPLIEEGFTFLTAFKLALALALFLASCHLLSNAAAVEEEEEELVLVLL